MEASRDSREPYTAKGQQLAYVLTLVRCVIEGLMEITAALPPIHSRAAAQLLERAQVIKHANAPIADYPTFQLVMVAICKHTI